MKNDLPSGRKIFNPLSVKEKPVEDSALLPESESAVDQESVSAMSHDGDDICPKCTGSMQPALVANNVSVLFCDKCRVSNPTRA